MPNQKESNIDQNNMKENISSSSGEIVFSSLKTIEDGPANGKNLYAFGDGNGSWINILKQLYSRGIIKYQHGDKAFQQEISSFELAEQNVLDEFQKYAINNKATQIPPTLGNFYENQVFSYLDNLDAFFKKFTCQKVSGDPVDVILIGDLLNDRFTNNYGMISLLAAFGSEINFKVIFSNHDFHAINQFKVLRNSIDQYKNNNQHSKENPAYIENFIFKPLLNEINRMVGSFAVKDNAGSVLASGVHFGLSSITWFFTLKHLVGKEKTIQPLEHFLNMVDKHYYPIVELALGRSYKTNEEEKYAVFTHAPSMFTIPNLSSLNEDAVKELCIKLLNEDQQLGGSFRNLYLRGITKNNFTINVAKNILDNIATYPITGLFNYMQNKFSANIDGFTVEKKKSLVESVNALKSAYESSLSTYNNSINEEAMRKSLVRSIVDIISLMSDLKNLYLQNNLIEDLLTDYEILKFTQNRVLYKNPYTSYMTSFHGHIGYMSSKIYNDHTASSFNLDSNGGKDNQEIHRYAGMHTMFQANKGQKKLPATPIAESKQKTKLEVKNTPGASFIQEKQKRLDQKRMAEHKRKLQDSHGTSYSSVNKKR